MDFFEKINELYKLGWSLPDLHFFTLRGTVQYLKTRPHLALEQADTNKDWIAFRRICSKSPDILNYHLTMTRDVFDYNIYKLPKEEQDQILK